MSCYVRYSPCSTGFQINTIYFRLFSENSKQQSCSGKITNFSPEFEEKTKNATCGLEHRVLKYELVEIFSVSKVKLSQRHN